MTNHPIERLRNQLSPFMNLVSLLTLKQVEIKTDNPTLTILIEKEVKQCAENFADVQKFLDDADELIDKSGFQTLPVDVD